MGNGQKKLGEADIKDTDIPDSVKSEINLETEFEVAKEAIKTKIIDNTDTEKLKDE